MRRIRTRAAGAALLMALVALGAAGCAQAGESASRHTLYDSLDSLARDSSDIVIGPVSAQREETSDGFASTVSTVDVINVPTNPSLGSNVDSESEPVAVGDVIEVRQDGHEPSVLRSGQEYMLYLRPTELPGSEAEQFFITGAIAGAYVRDGDSFRRVTPDSGDDLPDTIDITGTED